ncbi:MAG: hypothetical protein ACO253_08055, partial [Burkholderiaceae bacterium]
GYRHSQIVIANGPLVIIHEHATVIPTPVCHATWGSALPLGQLGHAVAGTLVPCLAQVSSLADGGIGDQAVSLDADGSACNDRAQCGDEKSLEHGSSPLYCSKINGC